MNKILLYTVALFFAFTTISCKEDVENWDSQAIEYSGRYVIKILDADAKEVLVDYGKAEYRIYNTSADKKDMIWIDDAGDNGHSKLPIKEKFTLMGMPSAFSSNTAFDKLNNNLNAVEAPEAKPTAENETKVEERDNIRFAILEGKILPKAATSVGGNTADSIYLKLKCMSGTAKFKSLLKDKAEWKDPDVKEFKWKLESVTYDKSKDETYVIQGYRYTGFPEDVIAD